MTYTGSFILSDISASIDRAKITDIEGLDYSDHVKNVTRDLAELESKLRNSRPDDRIRHAENLYYLMTQSALITNDEDPRRILSLSLYTDIDGYIVRNWLPGYLESNNREAYRLWEKLIGKGENYTIEIEDREYEMEGDSGVGGLLNQKEAKKLGRELGKLDLSSSDISTKDERYNAKDSDFVKYGGLERIYEMCKRVTDRKNTVLIYEGPH